jgi:hypothetical protein
MYGNDDRADLLAAKPGDNTLTAFSLAIVEVLRDLQNMAMI